MTRNKWVPMVPLLAVILPFVSGCATVKETGRRQLMLVTPGQEQSLGAQAYQKILSKAKRSTDTRMTAVPKARPPEFLSTHPLEKQRIELLEKEMPVAMEAYNAAQERYGLGERW